MELPSLSQAVHGAERPFAKHRKSRHFHPDSTVKSTGRLGKLPGPGPLLGSIPFRLCRPTLLRFSSPFFPSGMVSAFPQILPVPLSSMVRVQDCRAPLLEECPQHHGHKGDPGVMLGTCGTIGERAQVILVWVRAPGRWERLPPTETRSHEG